MVFLPNFVTALATMSLVGSAVAHPGGHDDHAKIKRDLAGLNELAGHAKRSLGGCSNSLKARELNEQALRRRAAIAKELRTKRGISDKPLFHRRALADLESWETLNHQANGTGFSLATPEATIFGANTSCILTPENTIGPYYVYGENIRSNVTETQVGVPMHLEMQFVDINTCEAVPDLLIDIWACNATGVYSGVEAEDTLQSTFLRGIQQTDDSGVVQFDTIVPGHYSGRATHEHVVVTSNATILPNGTFTGGTTHHIGQLYFDESLRSAVEATYPYNTNTIAVTTNDEDMWASSAADAEYDPFPEYVMLGDSLDDGLLFWISIGVNMTADVSDAVSIASYWEADGGHSNSASSFPG